MSDKPETQTTVKLSEQQRQVLEFLVRHAAKTGGMVRLDALNVLRLRGGVGKTTRALRALGLIDWSDKALAYSVTDKGKAHV